MRSNKSRFVIAIILSVLEIFISVIFLVFFFSKK